MNKQASKRLKELINDEGISEGELARRSGVPQPTINRILSGESKDPRPATLQKLADYFRVGLDEFLMGAPRVINALTRSTDQSVSFGMMSIELSMGPGMTAEQTEYQVQSFETTRRWARSKLSKVTAMENVKIITGLGDSMSGLYEDGDALFCDTGVRKVDIDAVFALRYQGELFIKRIQRIPGGRLRLISDNKDKYDPITVEHKDLQDFQVLGRIVGTLNFNEV